MIQYIEFLGVPTTFACMLVGIFLFCQIVGEVLEFKGKIVPEGMKVRKYFSRKKVERETLRLLPGTLSEIKASFDEFNKYYDKDNISKRNDWIHNVDNTFKEHEHWAHDHEDWAKQIVVRLDQVSKDVLTIRIDDMRSEIINFASYVINKNNPVTREQFNRIFKIHGEYENIIKKNKITNGEIDIAFHIIEEAYEAHLKNHTFIEDIRGYNL